MLFQQCNELLFKRQSGVMLFLILDISHHGRNIRFARPKPAIALLPGEPANLAGHPPRRVRLYFLDCIGNHEGGWKLQQQMNVVFHPSDGVDEDALVPANAGGIRPSAVLSFASGQFSAALLC